MTKEPITIPFQPASPGEGQDHLTQGKESFFFFFFYHVFVVKVQETAWSASYGVNKTINNPTTRFTPSWEKSNRSKPEPTLPPRST